MIKKIQVFRDSRNMNLGSAENYGLGIENDNLVDTLFFEFDKMVEGQAELLTDLKGEDGLSAPIPLIKVDNGYQLEIKKEMLTQPKIRIQLMVSYDEEKVWHSKDYDLYIGECLEAGSGPMPSGIDLWIIEADKKLDEVNNAITLINETIGEEVARVTEKIEEVSALERNIITEEDERQENEEQRQSNEQSREEYITELKARVDAGEFKGEKGDQGEQGIQGEKGDPGAIKYQKVEVLPSTGKDDTIYLVPKENPEEEDKYDEWQYIDGEWEKWNGKTITADLTNYVQFTDYATQIKGGVIKTQDRYGITTSTDGVVFARSVEYKDYANMYGNAFISKSTLENVIQGKGLIDSNTKEY